MSHRCTLSHANQYDPPLISKARHSNALVQWLFNWSWDEGWELSLEQGIESYRHACLDGVKMRAKEEEGRYQSQHG